VIRCSIFNANSDDVDNQSADRREHVSLLNVQILALVRLVFVLNQLRVTADSNLNTVLKGL